MNHLSETGVILAQLLPHAITELSGVSVLPSGLRTVLLWLPAPEALLVTRFGRIGSPRLKRTCILAPVLRVAVCWVTNSMRIYLDSTFGVTRALRNHRQQSRARQSRPGFQTVKVGAERKGTLSMMARSL